MLLINLWLSIKTKVSGNGIMINNKDFNQNRKKIEQEVLELTE